METPPSTILIVGHGVFGLSTALALTQRPLFSKTKITLLDRSPFPSLDGSSIDTSRIVRSDYSDPLYAKLGAEAMEIWRSSSSNSMDLKKSGTGTKNILAGLGEEARYTESGLVLVCNRGQPGEKYVTGSFENMVSMANKTGKQKVRELRDRREIEECMGTGGGSGDWGYINESSGWADAEACMRFLYGKVEETGRVEFITGTAVSLLHSQPPSSSGKKGRIQGVQLSTNQSIPAELTILALGAWTGSLLDLRGRATATGQVLTYIPISPSEVDFLSKNPVLLNMSSAMFIIPPSSSSSSSSFLSNSKPLLKIARHGYGYKNPVSIPHPHLSNPSSEEKITVSLPRTKYNDPTLQVPPEGQTACRQALAEMIPSLSSRPFTETKICWYNDTPTGDFLISYHPEFEGVFLATGGNGHGFKFLPVIGERVLDVLMQSGEEWREWAEKWRWPERVVGEEVVTEDGSRGGRRGMVLDVELGRGMGRESRL